MGGKREPDVSGIHAMLLSSGGGAVGGSGSVTLNNANVDSQNTGADATASWRIDSDGNMYDGYNGVYFLTNQWTADAVANYEVRANIDGGSTPSGSATGTWLSCSTDRDWTITDTTVDAASEYTFLQIKLRDAATTTVLATCYVDLYAERIS